jgi:rRNA maturation endonuclease Nob1
VKIRISDAIVGVLMVLCAVGALLWARSLLLGDDVRHAIIILTTLQTLVILGIAYAIALARWRYHKGCCVGCGYYPRIAPGRCPRCGRVAKKKIISN